VKGLEFFGIAEQAKGSAATETKDRTWNQYAGEVTYRFLADDRVFVSGRYNTAKGELLGITNKVSVDRYNVGGGWFVTPNVLAKAEYVNQKYNDFPTTDIRSGGQFKGFVIEGVVSF
jgi:ribosome-associated protein YbcJ (S4-like RNA binding protein)